MPTVVIVALVIVAVWLALPGSAYLLRHRFHFGRGTVAGLALALYGLCAAGAVATLGFGWQGIAGAFGMTLPLAVALLVTARL